MFPLFRDNSILVCTVHRGTGFPLSTVQIFIHRDIDNHGILLFFESMFLPFFFFSITRHLYEPIEGISFLVSSNNLRTFFEYPYLRPIVRTIFRRINELAIEINKISRFRDGRPVDLYDGYLSRQLFTPRDAFPLVARLACETLACPTSGRASTSGI